MEPTAIIPGKSIAQFQLGWTFDELVAHLPTGYNIEDYVPGKKIIYKNFRFWIDKITQTVEQISVTGNFKGKFANKIGIGSSLADIEKQIGQWDEDLDVYILPNHKGICFELADNGINDEWIEDKMPIKCISVFYPTDNDNINELNGNEKVANKSTLYAHARG